MTDMKPTRRFITTMMKSNMSSTTITTAIRSIMLIASGSFTGPIFTTLSTGIPGIMIRITTIRTLTHRGTIRPGRMAGTGDGDIAGIHPITVGDGVIHPITAIITIPTMPIPTDGGTPTNPGTDMAVNGMLILTTTSMGKEDQPAPMQGMATITDEELLPQLFGHRQPTEERGMLQQSGQRKIPEEALQALNQGKPPRGRSLQVVPMHKITSSPNEEELPRIRKTSR